MTKNIQLSKSRVFDPMQPTYPRGYIVRLKTSRETAHAVKLYTSCHKTINKSKCRIWSRVPALWSEAWSDGKLSKDVKLHRVSGKL